MSLDRRIYIQCPKCNFYARPFLRQVRHQETIICGGCKGNIRLVDHLGAYRKAEGQFRKGLDSLFKEIGNITINIPL